MHYANGRPAQNGDKVVMLDYHGNIVHGILYDAVAGNDFCNGRLALNHPSDPCPNLKECVHADDYKAGHGGLALEGMPRQDMLPQQTEPASA